MLYQEEETKLKFQLTEKAVLYARVSGDDTKKEGRNIRSQLEMCREYAQDKGYNIIDELHEDEKGNTSGADIDLPVLNRILEMARNDEFDVLVVRELDRLSRDVGKQLFVEGELKRYGVRVEYVLAEYDETAEGQFNKLVRAAVAEFERLKIKERMLRGRRNSIKAGKVIATKPPYGYRLTENNGLVVDESEAKIVKMIFNDYVSGQTVSVIARSLQSMGVPPPMNKGKRKWWRGTILLILKNESYIGKWHYGKQRWEKHPDPKRKIKTIFNSRNNWIMVEVEPIVSQELFDAAQRKRKENQDKAKRNTKHNYLMAKQMTCHHCESAVYAVHYRTGKYRYSYYYCKNRQCDNRRNVRIEQVDEAVWEWLKKLFRDEDNLRSKLHKFQSEQAQNPLHERLELLEQQMTNTEQEWEETASDWRKTKSEKLKLLLDRDLARLEKLMASQARLKRELKAKLNAMTLSNKDIDTIIRFARRISLGLDEAEDNFNARRWLIERLRVTATFENKCGRILLHISAVIEEDVLEIGTQTTHRRIN